jgi:hypothetical protein
MAEAPFEMRVLAVAHRVARLALRGLIVFAIAAGVMFGAAWSAKRWLGWNPPPAIERIFLQRAQSAEALLYVYDNDTGWRANPYTQMHHELRGPFARGEPQDVRVRTNSEGFFDREHYLRTPYYRIAFLGDSWVEAQQVDATNRFTDLVEGYVHAFSNGAKAVETMNFGLSNLGTAQELGVARTYVAKYKPDEVWLVFNPMDDISDSSALLTAPPLGPTFTYGADGAITDVRFGYPDPPAVGAAKRRERYGKLAGSTIAAVMPFLYSSENDAAFEAAFAEMRACFRLLRQALPGSRLTVLYLPPEREISSAQWGEYAASAAKAAGRDLKLDAAAGERRIAAMAREEGADFVTLRPLMREKGAGEMYQGHLSRMGHHWVADFIARRLLERGCCAAPGPAS